MKKTISIVLALLFAVGILAGCGTEKLDTSPHAFGVPEPGQTEEESPAAEATAPEADAADALTDVDALPLEPAGDETVSPGEGPLAAGSDAEVEAPYALDGEEEAQLFDSPAAEAEALGTDAADALTDVDALPLEPAGDETVGPGEGPLAAGSDAEIATPYAVGEEEEAQLFDSPATEAEALGLDSLPVQKSMVTDAAGPGDAPVSPEDFDNLPLEPAGDVNIGPGEGPLGEMPVDAPAGPEEVDAQPQEPAESFVPSEADTQFADEVAAQAFAVAMAYWDSGYGVETSPADPVLAWDALGWYAAWLYRTEDLDLIPAETARAFMTSLGCEDPDRTAEGLSTLTEPRAYRGRDGVSYDFDWYKYRIDELLGYEAEVAVTPSAPQTVDVTVTQHFDSGLTADAVYTFGFARNEQAESEFPWALQSVTLPVFAPEVDPALTFTWEQVEQANLLENVLAVYPAVRMYSREYPENGSTWLFQRNGQPALVVEDGDYCTGQYMGCWFDREADEAGTVRARVGAFDADAGTWDALNSTLLEGFRDAGALRLDRIEEDLIWADCLYRGGYRQKLAFDRGTLVLRELVVLSEEGEVLGSNCYDYTQEPDFRFLDSWDEALREVTVTWESFNGQEPTRYTETVSIPADWEYLPYEVRWGDYTAYNNEDYIGEYEYPGDSLDYELFLTTAKG